MVNNPHLLFNVPDRSYFAIVKKEIHQAAVGAQFTQTKVAEIDIIIAELVTNLVKHAGGGYLLVKTSPGEIEILSVDEGKGMTDVARMLQDGVSTKSTLGQGLGAIKRLSDVFQVYSLKDWGTIVLSKVFACKAGGVTAQPQFETASLIVAKPGETRCGDGGYIKITPAGAKIFLGDGLGHGIEAEKAVMEAISTFDNSAEKTPVDILREIHLAVKKTRGLVGTAAFIMRKEKMWSLCGIGNINTRIVTAGHTKNYMAYNGVLGLVVPGSMKAQETPLEKGQVIILCSDGIRTRWDLSKYPNITKYELPVILAAVFKDNARKTDDMSLLAVKYNG